MFRFGARTVYNGIRTAFRGGRGPIPRPPNKNPAMGGEVNKSTTEDMVVWVLSNRQRLVVRYFRHPTGGTAWTLVQDKQSWTRSPQMRFRQHWIPHLDKTAAVSPPHSERDVGAVLKATLWTNSGAAPAYFVVPVDLKPCPPYHIDPKLAISEQNVHQTPLNPSKHYPE